MIRRISRDLEYSSVLKEVLDLLLDADMDDYIEDRCGNETLSRREEALRQLSELTGEYRRMVEEDE
jgi:hypothetical protein